MVRPHTFFRTAGFLTLLVTGIAFGTGVIICYDRAAREKSGQGIALLAQKYSDGNLYSLFQMTTPRNPRNPDGSIDQQRSWTIQLDQGVDLVKNWKDFRKAIRHNKSIGVGISDDKYSTTVSILVPMDVDPVPSEGTLMFGPAYVSESYAKQVHLQLGPYAGTSVEACRIPLDSPDPTPETGIPAVDNAPLVEVLNGWRQAKEMKRTPVNPVNPSILRR